MRRESGFTIPELIITVGVLLILLTFAVPGFVSLTKNNRLVGQTNTLVADMGLARSEAIKRSASVILCRSADPNASPPSCGGSANTWTTGWLVFVSGDGNATYDPGSDTLLKVGLPASGNVTVRTNAAADADLQYAADGTTDEGGATARFAICDDRGEARGRQIDIVPTGRPELERATPGTPLASCTNPV